MADSPPNLFKYVRIQSVSQIRTSGVHPMQQSFHSAQPGWTVQVEKLWDVLGPFPIHAREHHYFPPSFPVDLSRPINYSQSWPSAYADRGLVSWSQALADDDGHLEIAFPNIRWKDLRSTEGWAALQHHAVLRTTITVYPPVHPLNDLPPRLLVDLKQGTYFALRPQNASAFIPEWYPGNVYDLERAISCVVTVPTAPSLNKPTKYDLFVSGDYEIRLFGDPLVYKSEFPVQKLTVKVYIQETGASLVHQKSQDVTCDFSSGYAFGSVFGVGIQSTTDWWTVHDIELKTHVPGMVLRLKDKMIIAPSQTRTVPIIIEQRLPFFGENIDIVFSLLSGETSEKLSISLPIVHRQFHLSTRQAIQATFLFANSMPTFFLAVPPQITEDSGAPILALHGAGVDILAHDFWVKSLPENGKAWMIAPAGRTSWGLDWHGPSALDAWASLDALSEISRAATHAFPQAWKIPPQSRAIVIGHSNGGQGTWYLASRYPDRVLAAVPASGYIKSQAYVPLTLARGGHFVDPSLRSILESSFTPDDNDLHFSNLVDMPILAIHGGDDENVPCWHSREATSTLKTWSSSAIIELKEDPGEGHWYSSVFQNADVQAFLDSVSSPSKEPTTSESFTLTVTSTHINGTLHEWNIDQLVHPGRLSRLNVRKIGNSKYEVEPSNVHTFTVPKGVLEVYIDGESIPIHDGTVGTTPVQIYQSDLGEWKVMTSTSAKLTPKGNHGRMQNILSTNGPVIIVISARSNRQDLSVALRIAHVLNIYHSLDAEIVTEDIAITWNRLGTWPSGNVIFIGISSSTFAKDVLQEGITDVRVVGSTTFIGKHKFRNPGQATLFLHPHPTEDPSSCMMFILYTDKSSLEKATRLFPFRTGVAVPDWLVVGKKMDRFGAGGIEGAGVWNNDWKLSEAMSWFDR